MESKPDERLLIRPLTSADAPAAARLHRAGQPGTFLTRLGPELLAMIYAALPGPGFGFVVESVLETPASGPAIGGFISGAPGIRGPLMKLLTYNRGRGGLKFLRALAGQIVRRPILLRYSAETLLYPLRAHGRGPKTLQRVNVSTSESATLELLSIMVEPGLRNRGLGARLMEAFLAECRSRGATAVDVTVDADNSGARRFYTQHEFFHIRDFRIYGRAMSLYRKIIS